MNFFGIKTFRITWWYCWKVSLIRKRCKKRIRNLFPVPSFDLVKIAIRLLLHCSQNNKFAIPESWFYVNFWENQQWHDFKLPDPLWPLSKVKFTTFLHQGKTSEGNCLGVRKTLCQWVYLTHFSNYACSSSIARGG